MQWSVKNSVDKSTREMWDLFRKSERIRFTRQQKDDLQIVLRTGIFKQQRGPQRGPIIPGREVTP